MHLQRTNGRDQDDCIRLQPTDATFDVAEFLHSVTGVTRDFAQSHVGLPNVCAKSSFSDDVAVVVFRFAFLHTSQLQCNSVRQD